MSFMRQRLPKCKEKLSALNLPTLPSLYLALICLFLLVGKILRYCVYIIVYYIIVYIICIIKILVKIVRRAVMMIWSTCNIYFV